MKADSEGVYEINNHFVSYGFDGESIVMMCSGCEEKQQFSIPEKYKYNMNNHHIPIFEIYLLEYFSQSDCNVGYKSFDECVRDKILYQHLGKADTPDRRQRIRNQISSLLVGDCDIELDLS